MQETKPYPYNLTKCKTNRAKFAINLTILITVWHCYCERFVSACSRGSSFKYNAVYTGRAKVSFGCDHENSNSEGTGRLWISCESWDTVNNLHFIRFWLREQLDKPRQLVYTASSGGWASATDPYSKNYDLIKFGFGGRLSVLVLETHTDNVTNGNGYFGQYTCDVMGLVGPKQEKIAIMSPPTNVRCGTSSSSFSSSSVSDSNRNDE